VIVNRANFFKSGALDYRILRNRRISIARNLRTGHRYLGLLGENAILAGRRHSWFNRRTRRFADVKSKIRKHPQQLGLLMGRYNSVKIFVAILIAVVPVCAQAQSPSVPKVTKTDAQKVVKIVSGNKAKTQTYCDMAKLFNQIERAGEKNIKKTAELNRKLDELTKKLGPEYAALVNGIPNVKPNSQEGKEISSTLAALDNLCAK
jgi:hypothetical protein